jgi:ABC-type Fe3+-hydroxamate transport system substrate-binding protein
LENRLIDVVNDIDRRLSALEERVGGIPDPFVLYYRPPGEDYKKINEVLDDVYGRLNILEIVLED